MLPSVERMRIDGPVGRVLERHYTLLVALRKLNLRATVNFEFTTAAAVEDTFPITIPFSDFSPVGVGVMRVVNLSDAAAIHYDAVWVDWEPVTDGIRVKYVTGLTALQNYRLTLEVRGA